VVMTRGGQPDRNIRPSAAAPPAGNGRYSQIGNPNAAGNSASDAAAGVYGSSDAPDAVRMDRMKGIADVALSDTTPGASYGDAFVQGQDWSLTQAKTVDLDGDLPSVPAFPGDVSSDSRFSYLGAPDVNSGKDISQPVSTKPVPRVSNTGSPQQTGRY
jgi:hypothetical protein